jgi:branched-chain amino acid aminotransferase
MSTSTGIPTQALAALYGKGVFTTLAIVSATPFLWRKHWSRLITNAALLGMDLSEFSETEVSGALAKSIEENNVLNGRARITFFDESSGVIWPFETTRKTRLVITAGDLRPVPTDFRLTVSPYCLNSRSPLAGIKSCNYLERLMILDEAKERGFDEAIQANERGETASAAMANVFWVTDSMLYTPSLMTGCLAGTTREFVLENIECQEVEAPVDELRKAEAILLTSAGLGIAQVAEFDGNRHKKVEHPILNLLPARI